MLVSSLSSSLSLFFLPFARAKKRKTGKREGEVESRSEPCGGLVLFFLTARLFFSFLFARARRKERIGKGRSVGLSGEDRIDPQGNKRQISQKRREMIHKLQDSDTISFSLRFYLSYLGRVIFFIFYELISDAI